MTAVTGPDRHKVYVIDSTRGLTFGRGPDADVRLRDTKASRVHCRLWLADGKFRIQALGSSERLTAEDFANCVSVGEVELKPEQADMLPLKEIEKRHIVHILSRTNWDKTRAASLLGIERSTLYQKLKQYGIMPPREQ